MTPRCTYLLPIRRVRADAAETAEFAAYFDELRRAGCEVLVIDGSPAPVFAAHARAWRGRCRHVTVDERYRYLNGKVNGIHTGIDLAGHERVIIADDDIRYTAADVERMCALLDRHECVRPQNYLAPRPWWARMEAARMLMNRGVLRAGDYPGTQGVRLSAMRRVGHYDGDVLFDNEELVRHFAACDADVGYARDFFIAKRPPTFAKWVEQRPRQAYEDFGIPAKTALFLGLLPAVLGVAMLGGAAAALAFVALVAVVAVTLAGRGRSGGAAAFVPASIALWAPAWVLERALSTWWAVYWRLCHGGYPFGGRLLSRGVGRDWSAGGRAARQRAA
ncbi:MAG TPA: glycosyltransferase [Methylomirabilota bacterium]|jgi:hypothetical protein|nr:glycosyltransferase [Methylomirabilota bacterium]